MARYYSLMIERDLFGTVRLVRHWDRIGAMQGRKLAQDFPTEAEAVEALERLAAAKRRRGVPRSIRPDRKIPARPEQPAGLVREGRYATQP
jgi:predicted DNA-binding WGR domain protein